MDNNWPPEEKEDSALGEKQEAPRKTCRVHLVGVFPGNQRVHLGPYTLPSTDEQSTTLLEFATTMKRLVRVTQGQDTWWRFEYSCYGNSVPILSDEALKEAFAYFREQHQTLTPEAAAAACRLYLLPTATQPGSWNLTEYLTETRVAAALNPQGSQSSGGRAGAQPEPSDAGTAAAATAGGGKPDGGASSSSSHEATDQHMAAAAAGTSSRHREGHEHMPPALLAAADNSSFSARKPSSQTLGWDYANGLQQQQQQQYSDSEAASRVAKRQAVAAVGLLEQQVWQQQQQQVCMVQAAAGTGPLVVQPQQQQLLLRSVSTGGDSRGIKAAKRDNDSSPRSQWEQQQQQLAPAVAVMQASQQQQQLQQQQGPAFVSPFAVVTVGPGSAAGGGAADSVVAAGTAMKPQQQQQQQQQQQLFQSSSSMNGFVAAQGLTMAPQQQQQVVQRSASFINPQLAGIVRPGLVTSGSTPSGPARPGSVSLSGPVQPGSTTLSGPAQPGTADSDTEGAGEACSLGAHVDQLQQLHLSTMSSSGATAGAQNTAATVAAPAANTVGAGWLLPTQQQQQLLAAQLAAAGQSGLLHHGSTGNLTLLASGEIARVGSQLDMAAAAAAAGVGGGVGTRSSAPGAAAAADGGVPGLQVTLSGGRTKTETKTKYADGRFKDEARHQQRLNDMTKRCNALFDGAITNHFRVEHHKRVTCLVCKATVVPYEAYHIDAVRKHFVRHHEPWLNEQGVNVDIWRKSCAPIAKGNSRSSSAGAARAGAAAAAAAAAESGGVEGDAAADLGEEEASGRRVSGTRLADGRYKDPQQHAQRLADMQTRCAALFNGTMTQHWTINNHKSITCHLCDQHITPYAAYHPDCLRKHFVRKHEDVLAAAGVDVSAWSKGIPLGRRKLKAMLLLLQQQQQQQQTHPQQPQQPPFGVQEQHSPELLLQLQEQQQQQQQGLQQPVLLQPTSSGAALQQQQQQQQVLLLQLQHEPGSWPWAIVQQQQQQQQSQALVQQQPSLSLPMQSAQQDLPLNCSSSNHTTTGMQPPVQQQQLMQLMLDGSAAPSASADASVQLHSINHTAPSMLGPSLSHLHGVQQQQQQAEFSFQQQPSFSLSAQQALQPLQQQQQPQAAVGFESPGLPADNASAAVPTSSMVTATVQFSQPQAMEPSQLDSDPNAGLPPASGSACTPVSLGELSGPAGQQLQIAQTALVGAQPTQQQQQRASPVTAARSALAPAFAAAAASQQRLQQPSGQNSTEPAGAPSPTPPVPAAGWVHNMGEAPMSLGQTPKFGAMSMGQTPGFGPMSLSPMIGLNDLGMGGIGSLTEADVAAMWEDDDADQALAEVLLKNGGASWSFGA